MFDDRISPDLIRLLRSMGHTDLTMRDAADTFAKAVLSIVQKRPPMFVKYTDDQYGEAARKFKMIQRAYPGDAGIDLPTVLAVEDREHGKVVFPGDRVDLHTGLSVAIPTGYWGFISHRSSTERRHRLRVIEGTIDCGWRGELLVQVHNGNTFPITAHHGQRMGQLIVLHTAELECIAVDSLPPSVRGTNGFGSSGI
jgi:dUTP pyrophosphatase